MSLINVHPQTINLQTINHLSLEKMTFQNSLMLDGVFKAIDFKLPTSYPVLP